MEACGEMSVPMTSVLQAFNMGGGARSILQLGHLKGYATLLIGFMVRRMGAERGLVSIDSSQSWISGGGRWRRAG